MMDFEIKDKHYGGNTLGLIYLHDIKKQVRRLFTSVNALIEASLFLLKTKKNNNILSK